MPHDAFLSVGECFWPDMFMISSCSAHLSGGASARGYMGYMDSLCSLGWHFNPDINTNNPWYIIVPSK